MSGTITVTTKPCTVCGKESQITAPAEGVKAWREGAFIQDALPELTTEEREMLISGTHPNCWDELFGDED